MSISSDHIIDVYVDGKQLKGAVLQHVTSITVAESFERLDMMEVVFAVPDKGKSRDDVMDLSKHGAKLKMDMKSDGKSGRVLEGTVVEVGYDGGSGHGMHMSLRGLSLLTKVKSTQFAKVHEGDDAAVIKAIASEAGLGADVQGVDGTGEFFFQPNLTNAETVQEIARRNNYVVRVDEGKLVFSRVSKAGGGAKLKIPWMHVSDFRLEQSLDGVVTDVMVTGKDLKANKWLKGKAAAGDVASISGGDTATALAKKAFGKVQRLIDHTDDADQSQLVAMAKGELQRRAERFVRGEFTTTFQADARTGAQLTFEDTIDWAMAGPFIVSEVTQLFDAREGYRTRFSVISDSLPPKK